MIILTPFVLFLSVFFIFSVFVLSQLLSVSESHSSSALRASGNEKFSYGAKTPHVQTLLFKQVKALSGVLSGVFVKKHPFRHPDQNPASLKPGHNRGFRFCPDPRFPPNGVVGRRD